MCLHDALASPFVPAGWELRACSHSPFPAGVRLAVGLSSFILFWFKYMHVFVCEYAPHVCGDKKPEEGIRSLRSPDMVAGD